MRGATAGRGLVVVVAVAGALHLLGRVTGGDWLALASAAVLVLPVVALALRPRLGDLEATRVLHGIGAVGDRVTTTLVLTNRGRRALGPVLVVDELPGHETVRVTVGGLTPGAVERVPVPRAVVHRTSGSAGVLRLSAWSPVGLLGSRRDVAVAGRVVAHPARVAVPALPEPRAGAVGPGGSSRPVPGPGVEVLGLRPWRAGDAPRALSARATARHGSPLVLERERDLDPSLVLLVAGGGSGPAWEQALAQAAALAGAAARTGTPPVVLGPPCAPHPGPSQVLDALAAADDAPPLSEGVLRRALQAAGPGGRVVLVAPAGALVDRLRARKAATASRCELVVLDA